MLPAMKKIHRAGRDLQHCGFHLSFILIVITGCDVKPYILIGMSRYGAYVVLPWSSFSIKYRFYHCYDKGT